MKKPIIICILLLIAVFGAGCVNIEETEPNSSVPSVPPDTYPPNTIDPIVGEWDGYDAAAKITYDLTCLYDGYAKLEIDYENAVPEQEYKLFGEWQVSENSYLLKLSGGDYHFDITEDKTSGILTIPDGTKVVMKYDSH